jgi:hypothetical protein
MTRDITVEMHVQLKEGEAGSGLARRASHAEAWEKVGRASDLTLKGATKNLRIIESFIKADVVKLASEQGQPLRQSYSILHRQSGCPRVALACSLPLQSFVPVPVAVRVRTRPQWRGRR